MKKPKSIQTEKPVFNILEPLYLIGTAALLFETTTGINNRLIDPNAIINEYDQYKFAFGFIMLFLYPTIAILLIVLYRRIFKKYYSVLIFTVTYLPLFLILLIICTGFESNLKDTRYEDYYYFVMLLSHLGALGLSRLFSLKWQIYKIIKSSLDK